MLILYLLIYFLGINSQEWDYWVKEYDHFWHLSHICHILLSKYYAAAAAAKSLQSCPTLCNPIDGSPPGAPVLGILQARTLEWAAISFSNAWKWKVKVKSLSRVRLSATPWTAAYQIPPSMGFSRQEYWSGVPLPFPRELLLICKCIRMSQFVLLRLVHFTTLFYVCHTSFKNKKTDYLKK